MKIIDKVRKERFANMTITEVRKLIENKYNVFVYTESPCTKGVDGYTSFDSRYLIELYSKKNNRHLGKLFILNRILKPETQAEINAIESWSK